MVCLQGYKIPINCFKLLLSGFLYRQCTLCHVPVPLISHEIFPPLPLDSEVCGVLHWTQYYGHAYNADKQTSRYW